MIVAVILAEVIVILPVLLYAASQWALRLVLMMTLSGGVLTLALLVLRPLLRSRLTRKGEYRLWKIALAGFLVPVSLFLTLRVSTPISAAQNVIQQAVVERHWDGNSAVMDWIGLGHAPVYGDSTDIGEDAPGGPALDPAAVADQVLILLPIVSAALFLVTWVRYRRFYKELRRTRLPAREEETAKLLELRPSECRPKLFRSPLVPTPMLVGVLDPAIYLPDREYTDKQLENILRHELAHYCHGDVPLKWWAVLAACLHWFNPLAWLVRRELARSCELACDEAVIQTLDSTGKQDYGDTLIDMAAPARLPGAVISTAVCEEKKNLKDRLTAILNSGRLWRGAASLSAVLAVLALCTAAALGASQPGGYIDPDSVVSGTRMAQVLEQCPIEQWYDYVPLYDAIPELKEVEALPGAYTGRLVRILNASKRTAYEPASIQRARFYMGDTWVRLDCADGGYYLFHYWYANGFSFNPLHGGEDDYYSLLTRFDAAGRPLGTWKMEYDFDYVYINLERSGSISYDPYYSFRAGLIREAALRGG